MNLVEIQDAWAIDCEIDNTEPEAESSRSPKLHSKYSRELVEYKNRLAKVQDEAIVLYNLKSRYYRGELSMAELDEHGWEQWEFKTMKSDLDKTIQADPDMRKLLMRENYYKNVISYLESILREIHTRSFHIRNIVEYRKFRAGV